MVVIVDGLDGQDCPQEMLSDYFGKFGSLRQGPPGKVDTFWSRCTPCTS